MADIETLTEAPGAEAVSWRVGHSLGRTLYRDEVLVGMVDTPEIAAEIVEAMNQHTVLWDLDKQQLTAELNAARTQLEQVKGLQSSLSKGGHFDGGEVAGYIGSALRLNGLEQPAAPTRTDEETALLERFYGHIHAGRNAGQATALTRAEQAVLDAAVKWVKQGAGRVSVDLADACYALARREAQHA